MPTQPLIQPPLRSGFRSRWPRRSPFDLSYLSRAFNGTAGRGDSSSARERRSSSSWTPLSVDRGSRKWRSRCWLRPSNLRGCRPRLQAPFIRNILFASVWTGAGPAGPCPQVAHSPSNDFVEEQRFGQLPRDECGRRLSAVIARLVRPAHLPIGLKTMAERTGSASKLSAPAACSTDSLYLYLYPS